MATITKRRNKNGLSFRIRASIGTDEKGDSIQKSMTWKPPANMTERQAERQAQREADKFEEMLRKGINTDKITFQALSEMYLKDIAKTQKPKAVTSHRDRLKRINQHIGHFEIKDITANHIRNLIKELEKPVKRSNGTVKPLAPATIRGYFRTVSCVFSFACQNDFLTENVCLGKKISLPKVDEGVEKMIQPETLNAYIKALETAPIKYKTFFKLILATGMRTGEALALKWQDIDFQEKTISINEAASYIPEIGTIYQEPKTKASMRTIVVSDTVIVSLKELKLSQTEERLKAGYLWKRNPDNPSEEYCENHNKCNKQCKGFCSKHCKMFLQQERVFTGALGAPLAYTTMRNYIQKVGKRNNLPHITVHGLRHSAVSMLIDSGEALPAIAAFVGHANTQTTSRVYAHAIAQSTNKLSSSIEDYLKNAQ